MSKTMTDTHLHWVYWVYTTWLTGWLDLTVSLTGHARQLRALPVGADARTLVWQAGRVAQRVQLRAVAGSKWRNDIRPDVYSAVYHGAEPAIAELVVMQAPPGLSPVWHAEQCARHAAMAAVLRPCWDAAMAAVESPDVDPKRWRPVVEHTVQTCVRDLLAPVADRLSASAPVWGAR
jgi:hypothetical protein